MLAIEPLEPRWIPACAWGEWGIWIAFDPPTQPSSYPGDDDRNFTVVSLSSVTPAERPWRTRRGASCKGGSRIVRRTLTAQVFNELGTVLFFLFRH